MNVDIFSLIIEKLNPADTRTFNSLRLLCKTSWKACVKHSKNLLKSYYERPLYIYYQSVESQGYKIELNVLDRKPTLSEVDYIAGYGRMLFVNTRTGI